MTATLNPATFYSVHQVRAALSIERAIICEAERRGQPEHPRAVTARENVTLLESISHEYAA